MNLITPYVNHRQKHKFNLYSMNKKKSIDHKLYKKLARAASDRSELATMNDCDVDNATFYTLIFDRSIREINFYEAEPIGSLSNDFNDLAISYKAYIDDNKKLRIVMPDNYKNLIKEGKTLSKAIYYIQRNNLPNVDIRVATDEMKDQMTKVLKGEKRDFICGDNKFSRISGSKRTGKIYVSPSKKALKANKIFETIFPSLPAFF